MPDNSLLEGVNSPAGSKIVRGADGARFYSAAGGPGVLLDAVDPTNLLPIGTVLTSMDDGGTARLFRVSVPGPGAVFPQRGTPKYAAPVVHGQGDAGSLAIVLAPFVDFIADWRTAP